MLPAQDPYALDNLFQAGTLTLQIPPPQHREPDGVPLSAETWRPTFSPLTSAKFLQPDSESSALKDALSYLVHHHFAVVTHILSAPPTLPLATLRLRIYLVPHDLPGLGGALLCRSKAVCSHARDALEFVLQRTSRRATDWCDAHPANAPQAADMFCYNPRANDSLADVFADLPSPVVSVPDEPATRTDVHHAIADVLHSERLPGMRSALYSYQRRSAARMLQQELAPESVPDPTFRPFESVNSGALFYLRPSTFELRRERPMFVQRRSGILAEDMGSGKTVIILQLILASKDLLRPPEDTHVHFTRTSNVMTPLAFRHFPREHAAMARYARECGNHNYRHFGPTLQRSEHNRVPSLAEFALDRLSMARHLVHAAEEELLRDRKLWESFARNTPFYLRSFCTLQGDYSDTRTRAKHDPGPRKFFLTAATLVIVPETLYKQWVSEIAKHCEGDALRVLMVPLTSNEPLPHPSRLASDYDIVLISHDRLALEAPRCFKKDDLLHTWVPCRCPPVLRSRVPDCACGPRARDVSPLLQVHWQRLVIDEGHTLAAHAGHLAQVADVLTAHARWIVSGTPTTHLRALGTERSGPRGPRAWPDEDLAKLKRLLVNFLHLPQATQDVGSNFFATHVTAPLRRAGGPAFGAVDVVQALMQQCMIRHRMCDMEREVVLPALHKEVILLDLDPLGAITYNVLQALVALNAVDSQRTDQDYFFHASNVAPLQQAIHNQNQSLFWHSDSEALYNEMEEHIGSAAKVVEKARELAASQARLHQRQRDALLAEFAKHGGESEPQRSDAQRDALRRQMRELEARQTVESTRWQADIALVENAKAHIHAAANNTLWAATMKRAEAFVPFRVASLPAAVHNTWCIRASGVPEAFIVDAAGVGGFAHPDKLLQLQRWVVSHAGASEDPELVALRGREVAALVAAREHEMRARKERKEARGERKRNAKRAREDAASKPSVDAKAAKASVAAEEARTWTGQEPQRATACDEWTRAALKRSCLVAARVRRSVSTKLNFVLSEVLKYSAEKFLIFSSSPLSLAHVGEALALFGIAHRKVMTSVKKRLWAANCLTFQTSDTCRVLLIELQHGARGLNLVAATRIIFLEPVWRADEEAQAVKRAHRIGQLREISVKTLAIRGTFEEMMLQRREVIKSEHGTATMEQDIGMREFIANPRFLNVATCAPARCGHELDVALLPGVDEGTAEDETVDGEELEPRKKKRRVVLSVRFAESGL